MLHEDQGESEDGSPDRTPPPPWRSLPCSKKKQPECSTEKCHLGWITSTKPAGCASEMPSYCVVSWGPGATGDFLFLLEEKDKRASSPKGLQRAPWVDPLYLESHGIIYTETLA